MRPGRARAGPGRGLGGTGHPRAQASQARAQASRARAPGQAWAWWCCDARPGQQMLAWLPGLPGTRVPGPVLVVDIPKTQGPGWSENRQYQGPTGLAGQLGPGIAYSQWPGLASVRS